MSFNNKPILIGNMISDFVKGNKQYEYDKEIQKGISLHRLIDEFTDHHAVTREAKTFFKPAVGSYSGAFADVVYDHFLANDENEFTNESLQQFVSYTYDVLDNAKDSLPENFYHLLPHMISHNWLYNYRTIKGIKKSFEGVVRRAVYLQSSENAFECFIINYVQLQKCYQDFFPDLKQFAYNRFLQFTS